MEEAEEEEPGKDVETEFETQFFLRTADSQTGSPWLDLSWRHPTRQRSSRRFDRPGSTEDSMVHGVCPSADLARQLSRFAVPKEL